jgi:hypothetical protein
VSQDLKTSEYRLNPALFTTATAPYWSPQAKALAEKYPWMADLLAVNREQAALTISRTLGKDLFHGRMLHDDLTGVHKAMSYEEPEKVSPFAMEPAFRAVLSRIPSLKVISPALAAALERTELELQRSSAHS